MIISVYVRACIVYMYAPWHKSQVEILFRNWIRSYFLLEKLATTQFMEIPAYQGIQIPLTCLQEGATESCFERHESNLHPLLLFLQNKVNVIISSTPYFSLDFKNSVPHISILCAFLRTACSHLTFLNFITMITYVGIHFVIFCILLIFFFCLRSVRIFFATS